VADTSEGAVDVTPVGNYDSGHDPDARGLLRFEERAVLIRRDAPPPRQGFFAAHRLLCLTGEDRRSSGHKQSETHMSPRARSILMPTPLGETQRIDGGPSLWRRRLCALAVMACMGGLTTSCDQGRVDAPIGGDAPSITEPDGDDVQPDDADGDTQVHDDPTEIDDTASNPVEVNGDAMEPEPDDDAELDASAGLDADAEPDGGEEPDGDTEPDADADAAIDASPDADADVDADTGTDPDARWPDVPLFDMPRIADPASADCTYTRPRVVAREFRNYDVMDVSYRSWEVRDGVLEPITIRGYLARPQSAAVTPGVVVMHGLGGHATESGAVGLAHRQGVAVLAPTGPGGGATPSDTSEGLPSGHAGGYRMFETLEDPRSSWFWGHAVAAMRGITCLAARSDVDATRLGMTGYSAGGVASLISAGVDRRLVAAVPISGTGGWYRAVESPNAWQHRLLTAAGLTIASDEWTTLMRWLDPAVVVAEGTTPVMIINGSTDEFFPLTAHVETIDAIGDGVMWRTSIAANYDHGCYALTGIEDAGQIEQRASMRAEGGARAFFHHHFGTHGDFATLPETPTVLVDAIGPTMWVRAAVDPGGARLEVESVHFWWSNDHALIFGSQELRLEDGEYRASVLAPLEAHTVYFVDVQYRTRGVERYRFSASSTPHLPTGHVPTIRSIDNCLP